MILALNLNCTFENKRASNFAAELLWLYQFTYRYRLYRLIAYWITLGDNQVNMLIQQ